MDPAWLLLLLPLAVASGWVGARRRFSSPRGNARPVSGKPYLETLNLVINDQHDKALDVLSTALQEHDQDLEIQLALGSLFRRRGEIERATQIHQRLLARPAQSPEQKSQVLFELANDYFKAGLLDRAENLLKEASTSSVVRESAFRLLIQIYESEKEWANAIEAVLALASLSGEDLSHSTAQYHCELADRAIAEGDLDSAERSVSKALRYRPRFARATILQGRLRAAGGHHAKAIGIWTDLLNASPEFAHEVVKLVKHSAESLGEAHRYSAFLQRAIETSGDDRIRLLYSDFLAREGREEEAERYLWNWVTESSSLVGLHQLLEIKSEQNREPSNRDEYRLFRQVTAKLLQHRIGYECRFCGFQGRSMHWQCPGCRHWDTTGPRASALLTQEL